MSEEEKTPEATTPEPAANEAVPYARFAEVLEERNQLREVASGLPDLQQKIEGFETERKSWAVDREFMTAGLTDSEGLDVAKYLYGKIEGEARPSVSDWLATPPKALAGYFKKTGTAPTPAAPALVPDANKGTTATSAPATGEPISADMTRQIVQEAVKTGDWSRYREARDAILAAARKVG